MKKLLTLASLLALMLAGCTGFEESATPIEAEYGEEIYSDYQTRASVPAPSPSEYRINPDNPYALHNVQQALKLVRSTDATTLEPTHHYVRFLPQDTTHMYILIDSLDLDITPYPRDWMLTSKEREAYKNAETNGFPWYYCIVEPDFQMPTEIRSEFLDYAYVQPYITDSSSKYSNPTSKSERSYQLSSEIFAEVLDRSIEITGNAVPRARTRTRAAAGMPSARITFVSGDAADTSPIPLRNVRVTTRYFMVTYSGYTDAFGEVTLSGLPSGVPVEYTIYWWYEDKWTIRYHNSIPAIAISSGDGNSAVTWDKVISGDNEEAMWATIHRALDAYYFSSFPKAAGLAKWGDTDVWARYGEYLPAPGGNINGQFDPDWAYEIEIFGNDGPNSRRHNTAILGTMFHELGHASHLQAAGRNTYNNAENILHETWATGVRYVYMSSLYPNHYTTNDRYVDYSTHHPAIIESLMWQGMSLSQLQTALTGKTTLYQFQSALSGSGIVNSQLRTLIFNETTFHIPLRLNLAGRTISGSSNPPLNTQVNYTFSTTGFTWPDVSFANWNIVSIPDDAVMPRDFEMSGSNTPNLTVKFKSPMRFVLSARIMLPGGEYTVTKEIDLRPLPPVPSITVNVPYPPLSAEFTVTNPIAGVKYEWDLNGDLYSDRFESGSTMFVDNQWNVTLRGGPILLSVPESETESEIMAAAQYPMYLTVKCRGTINGLTSAWSNEVIATIYSE